MEELKVAEKETRRWRPRVSLRGLLLAMLLVSIGLAMVRAAQRGFPVVYTGRSLDVAIRGSGYFSVSDQFGAHAYFTRDGRLAVDVTGLLCVVSSDEMLHLDPPLHIPSERSG